jgi:hypothetical protein
MKVYGGAKVSLNAFLASASRSCRIAVGEGAPGAHCTAGWVGPLWMPPPQLFSH